MNVGGNRPERSGPFYLILTMNVQLRYAEPGVQARTDHTELDLLGSADGAIVVVILEVDVQTFDPRSGCW
ncbi:hypothetical protein AA309_31265 [Microvirga vignae]|uniref:Uncharacterized protein n=1 Tax=Microvirga vignae TaxID=1225564 RepID=A0A0H1R2X3_9HYPH|nr:hypothetical protein AA309_31265 [Microvirga vignae]